MFSPAQQTRFSLTIDGIDHAFHVLAFNGEEALGRPYYFNVELVGERADMDLECLFDREAFLSFDNNGNGIHGRVYHIAQSGNAQCSKHYSMTLVPHLSYLRHRINQRIYEQFSVPNIVALILEEHGIVGDAYRFHLGSTYPERDYCTQYDETDLHFIQRLCEEEGIHFHFQHSAQGHVLVFGDDQAVFPRLGQPAACNQDGDNPLDIRGLADHQAEGHSDQTHLASGHVLDVCGHPRQALNAPWLLTRVIHQGRQPRIAGERGATDHVDDIARGYRNHFMAIPWEAPYRLPLTHRKPELPGNQTAVVIAVEDEMSQRDRRLAKIQVKFPWDREDWFDDKSSCWLSASSSWSCASTPPHTGMEVMVTFVENDPDQPLISGCLCCR